MVLIYLSIGIILLFIIFWLSCLIFAQLFGAPTVHSSERAVIDALRLAKLKKGELLVDLGCGGARVLVIAANKFGARCVGIDRSPYCYLISKLNVLRSGKKNDVKIFFGEFKKVEKYLKQADVVYLYLLNSVNRRIEDWLFKSIDNKTRVVSLAFDFQKHSPKNEVGTIVLGHKTKARLY